MVLDQVRVSMRHTLNCANDATVATLESPFSLGPMDYAVPARLTIEAILIYRKPTAIPDDSFLPVERLKVAASHLLDYYPHLTGRLRQNSSSRGSEIGSLGTGAELWEAGCSRRLRNMAASALSARILVIKLPDSGNALLPIFHATRGATHNPIFAIQHTRFGCGGVALGIRVHHLVCDATGFMQLVHDLAGIYKQLRDSSPPTLISPPEIISHFRGTNSPSASQKEIALAFNPPNFYLDADITDTHEASTPPTVITCPMRFQGQYLVSLKNAATDPNTQGQTSFTTFEVLSAYLYQRIYQARIRIMCDERLTSDLDSLQPLRGFWTTMDMRDSTRLNLPARYFPNAVHCLSTSTSHELLARGAISQVARVVYDAIHSVDMDEVKRQFEWIAAQPHKIHVKSKNKVPNGSFIATQWTRGKTYVGVDFEVTANGRRIAPDLVSPAFSDNYRVDGYAIVMSTEEQLARRQINGKYLAGTNLPCAVDVNLSLDSSVWDVLNSDPDFLALHS
ncbi:hypothetical protein N7463_007902 [Penicillium fimorum]|uniref:Transferase n=1 Tax=Penicillium fimorum TaxID=1882269 RepID=A0A9W9XXB3_9EURO|nr:hypothetical protein N7463_007902 [Penicillium fimorum]